MRAAPDYKGRIGNGDLGGKKRAGLRLPAWLLCFSISSLELRGPDERESLIKNDYKSDKWWVQNEIL
jgi:hypothetical protein